MKVQRYTTDMVHRNFAVYQQKVRSFGLQTVEAYQMNTVSRVSRCQSLVN